MEIHIPSFSAFLTFFIFLFMVSNIVWRTKSKKSNPKLPPGPWKLPIIGNMHHLHGILPHHALRNLAMKYGPLMHLKLGEVSYIIVSSPEIAKEFLKTHDTNFANRPFLLAPKILTYDCTGISFSPYGDYWRHLRKICSMELLSAKQVKSFRSIREEEVSNLIETIHSSEGSAINLSEKIYSLSCGITGRTAFGQKSRDQEAYQAVSNKIAVLAGGFYVADMYPSIKMLEQIGGLRHKLEKVHAEADRILENILNDHKEKKIMKRTKSHEQQANDNQEYLVDVFLKFQHHDQLDHPLTDSNIKAALLDIFTAGSDTSSTTVEWAMSEMVKNPRVMKEAQSEVRRVFRGKANVDETEIHELKYLRSVIKETMRLHPPAPLLLPKECSQSCVIDGYDIPKKSKVIVNAWAIGRDPMHWTEADKFYPERFLEGGSVQIDYKGSDFEFIPFGAGRRICPGITFGMAVVELTLAQLLFHFDWKLPNHMRPEDLDMTEVFGLTVKRNANLCLIPITYHPNLSVI
ncbi:cytochrome P450 71D9 [Ziziphus jujuba]|uniref:Cytochrome P450 71D9 n=2 Tax=Ziziphus jujuba TaxID=326968 RepID=A0ABM4A372_ZIZJJ|nr:cytochrome P450 71D9-like [Ziziphus jujuba var. spinosa]XP_060671130.1 cytochrome P450 71D9 [Ziziphus jujuba]XP_060671133.1 cytochrome P450 71D9 [Ziziphus jujuba]